MYAVDAPAHTHVEAMVGHWVSSSMAFCLTPLRQGVLLMLKLTVLSRLAGQ